MSTVEGNFEALDRWADSELAKIRARGKIQEAQTKYAAAVVKVEWLEMIYLYPRDLGEPEWDVFV